MALHRSTSDEPHDICGSFGLTLEVALRSPRKSFKPQEIWRLREPSAAVLVSPFDSARSPEELRGAAVVPERVAGFQELLLAAVAAFRSHWRPLGVFRNTQSPSVAMTAGDGDREAKGDRGR